MGWLGWVGAQAQARIDCPLRQRTHHRGFGSISLLLPRLTPSPPPASARSLHRIRSTKAAAVDAPVRVKGWEVSLDWSNTQPYRWIVLCKHVGSATTSRPSTSEFWGGTCSLHDQGATKQKQARGPNLRFRLLIFAFCKVFGFVPSLFSVTLLGLFRGRRNRSIDRYSNFYTQMWGVGLAGLALPPPVRV